jgi:hypothetical protein
MAKTEQKGRPLPLDDPRRSFFPPHKQNNSGDARKGGNAGKAPTYEQGQDHPYTTRGLPGRFKGNPR